MRLRHELEYDAPADEVFAMLTDPAYWDAVAVATGALSSETSVEAVGAQVRLTTEEDQRVAGVPSFAKKFVGQSTRAVKQMVWTASAAGYTATVEIRTPGKPTHLAGTASLAGAGADTGATLTYDLEISASVPLVGGRLEKLVAELTTEGFDKERAAGAAWLKGTP